MHSNYKKKQENFAHHVRSEQRQTYFLSERKKLIAAQEQGDIDLEHLIISQLADQFGNEELVWKMLKEYADYEKSIEDYEKQIEQSEEASISFQKLQEQEKLEESKKFFEKYFQDLEREQQKKQKAQSKSNDIEI